MILPFSWLCLDYSTHAGCRGVRVTSFWCKQNSCWDRDVFQSGLELHVSPPWTYFLVDVLANFWHALTKIQLWFYCFPGRREWNANNNLTDLSHLSYLLVSSVKWHWSLFSLQIVFRPPLDLYDVLIHLNANQIPRHLERVDRPVKSFSRGVVKNSAGVRILFPVVDYDPVQCYLQDLRVSIVLWEGAWAACLSKSCVLRFRALVACHCRWG